MSLSSDGPDDALDEDLDAPERSSRRPGWLVGALIVALAIWALSRPSGTPPPRHVARPAPVASTAAPACPPPGQCAVRVRVPAAVARLARIYLPSGMRLRVRTVIAAGAQLRPTLLTRDIEARVDSVTVLVRVQRGGSGTDEIAPDPLGVGSLLLHQANAGYLVRLQYLAPDTVPPMLDRLQALIRDPGLISS